MADVHDKKTRSYNMSRIRSKNTKPEIIIRKFLFSQGFRYRLHDKKLPGKPDIVLTKYKTVIFIDGCFWHGHKNCKYFTIPKTHTEFWLAKIQGNMKRDMENMFDLRRIGWKVLTIFECKLRNTKRESTLSKLLIQLKRN